MKQFLKRKLFVLLIIVLIVALVGCATGSKTDVTVGNKDNKADEQQVKMRVAALNGPTGMGMVGLMDKHEAGEAALDYEFTLLGSPDDLVAKVISGEVDAAAVPTNLAMLLHNKTEGAVQLAAVNTLGVLYVLENGESIKSIEDLRGKEMYASGKGASPDYVFQYILNQNQIVNEKDITIDYKLQHAELAAALASGDVNIALLPQPHVTTAMLKNPKLRIALDITEEWNKATDNKSTLAMGVIIVQKSFAENNKAALDAFLEEYKASVEFVNADNDAAASLIEKYKILPNAAVAKKAIPLSNIVYLDAQEAKAFLQDFYQVLYSFDPKAVGGKIADDSFYYKK